MAIRPNSLTLPPYIWASILCSANGLLFGMDTGIIGPVTDMTLFRASFGGSQNSTIHGLIVSSILLPAALSSIFAGYVADKLGRPKGIGIGVFIFGVGAAIEAGAVSLGMFIAGRVIEGLGEGLFLGNLVVLICEISPTSTRGPLTTGPQLVITLGLVIGFFTCYGTQSLKSSLSWRTPFILLSSLSMVLCAGSLLFLPESPRWLSLHGRHAQAAEMWHRLGVSQAEREKAEQEPEIPEEVPAPVVVASSKESKVTAVECSKQKIRRKLLDVFSRDVRSRTLLAVFLMGMQQLSGIDGVLYYAPLLFQQAGLSSSDASFFASGVSALVIFAVTIPGLIYADRWGRRTSIVYGGLGLGIVMFLIGGLYAGNAVHSSSGAGRWVVIVSIYIFAVIFSMTWAIAVKVYSAEIQPQRTRASATTLSHSSNWVCNFLVALTTPILLDRSSFGAYFLWGGCSIATALVGAIYMHETKGRSLDEIEHAFRGKPSTEAIFHSSSQTIPGSTA
ncbi:hypothetical protein N7462_002880 [Penicillium macrosclerotiorum]|uniref:uncharacterized protein n=1 Tax=Penicillium macrosclerotiorum TaxID=303699 RepID=UPI0025482CF2|nr:uncharacterized protein N7462_002880 [Penicillium macrosclerotiorum]KAJ5693457.1 hypothetical protein N7462_002880 [Penicillium macrosclerotiorum]